MTVELVSPLGRQCRAEPAAGEELERLEAALRAAKGAHDAAPDTDTVLGYGRAIASLWRYHQAIEVFSRGLAQSGESAQLYRHRGHRYISIRDFDRAEADLARASALQPGDWDIEYHLGLARWLRGDYVGALVAYERCLELSATAESRVAISHWMYMTLRRLGQDDRAAELVRGFDVTEIEENTHYRDLVLLYRGRLTEEEIEQLAGRGSLDASTLLFGLGCYRLHNGDVTRAKEAFAGAVAGEYWPAFGFIGAEVELLRLGLDRP